MHEDQQFEEYLRQFTPRAPSLGLPSVQRRRPQVLALTAAAIIALAGVVSVTPHWPRRVGPPAAEQSALDVGVLRVTAGALLRSVRQGDPIALDTTLQALEQHTLVGVERPDGQLQALAKD